MIVSEVHSSWARTGRMNFGRAIFSNKKHRDEVSENLAAASAKALRPKTGPLLCHMSTFLHFGRECSNSLRSEYSRRANLLRSCRVFDQTVAQFPFQGVPQRFE